MCGKTHPRHSCLWVAWMECNGIRGFSVEPQMLQTPSRLQKTSAAGIDLKPRRNLQGDDFAIPYGEQIEHLLGFALRIKRSQT